MTLQIYKDFPTADLDFKRNVKADSDKKEDDGDSEIIDNEMKKILD